MIALRYVPIDRRRYPPPRRRAERFPLERLTLLAYLEDEVLYSPSAVAEVGYAKGSAAFVRARRAFSCFAQENGLKVGGDSACQDLGTSKAWYGSSWKQAAGGRMHKVADLMAQLYRRQSEHPDLRFYLKDEMILSARELTGLEDVKPLPTTASNIATVGSQALPPNLPLPGSRTLRSCLMGALVGLYMCGLLAWWSLS